ncbi:MAG TPA: FKBP-type peptidyl-prolyl cis-trans isomerase [Candidatus Dormibacteraeota bacterium]|nr:FKBP-type peptidyl-prolyl cis-trans isomerase [Candidatus Dormibacteraeota bacterium]
MNIGFKRTVLAVGLGLAFLPSFSRAADKPADSTDKSGLKDEKEKVSYSIGLNWGNMLKRSGYEVDVDVLASAIKDVVAGREPKLTEQQAREVMMAYQKEMQTKRQEEQAKISEKNKKEGEAFLAENKNKPGVKTHTVTLPDGTTAEMQYKVITEGKGDMPKSNDVVTVNYKGTLINGKEFDSSAKHGSPLKRPANSLIRGWTEALEMMKVGSKWELYLPASLAYGDRGAPPDIDPGATLIFEMELTGIEPPPAPPAPAQPLTSDIIRVPSAEELKKGAKIEVLKPEDVEKARKEAEEKEKQQKKP